MKKDALFFRTSRPEVKASESRSSVLNVLSASFRNRHLPADAGPGDPAPIAAKRQYCAHPIQPV